MLDDLILILSLKHNAATDVLITDSTLAVARNILLAGAVHAAARHDVSWHGCGA